MGQPEQRSWPAQERLLSPVLLAFFVSLAAIATLLVAEGHAIALVALFAFVCPVLAAGQRAVAPLEPFERRYGKSQFVAGRLGRRFSRQRRLRRAAPRVRDLARLSFRTLVMTFVAAVALGIVLSSAGVQAPTGRPTAWMLMLHVLGYSVTYVALTIVVANFVLHDQIRDWNKRARSAPRDLPVVTAREFFARFDRPWPFVLMLWTGLAVPAVALCFHA